MVGVDVKNPAFEEILKMTDGEVCCPQFSAKDTVLAFGGIQFFQS